MPTSFAPAVMRDFDRREWEAIQKHHARSVRKRALPARAQKVVDKASEAKALAAGKVQDLPGADVMQRAIGDATKGIVDTMSRASQATVTDKAVIKQYQRKGHNISTLAEIRTLPLEEVLRVKPSLDLNYALAAGAEGFVAGAAMGGGSVVATGGSVVTGGVAAAPGAAAIAATMAADAATVIAASNRVVAHTASYYGYDISLPSEQIYAAGVLGIGLAGGEVAKQQAYLHLNKLVQELARHAAWAQLNKNAAAQILQKVFGAMSVRLTQKKLAQALPVVGAVIGAGMNAGALRTVAQDADRVYRERFLREQYGIPFDVKDVEDDIVGGDDALDVAAMLDEALEHPASDSASGTDER